MTDKRTKAQLIKDYEQMLKSEHDTYEFVLKRNEVERLEWSLRRRELERMIWLQTQVLEIVAALNPERTMSKNSIKLIAEMATYCLASPDSMTAPHVKEYISNYRKEVNQRMQTINRMKRELSDGNNKF